MSTIDKTVPTHRAALNGSPQGGQRDLAFQRAQLGDILAGVRDETITLAANAPVIDLTGQNGIAAPQPSWNAPTFPPVQPGGVARVTAPTLWAANNNAPYLLGDSPAPKIATATTINGVDVNGGIVVTPKAQAAGTRPLRYMQLALAGTASRALYAFENEVWLILATVGGTIQASETAAAIIALLNGTSAAALRAQALFTFAYTGTGASKVGASTPLYLPWQGAYVAGPPVQSTPGMAATSQDGMGILFDQNVNTVDLSYTPASASYLDAILQSPQPR